MSTKVLTEVARPLSDGAKVTDGVQEHAIVGKRLALEESITRLEERIRCLERRIVIDELRVVARKLNVEQSIIDKQLHQWVNSLCLMDGVVCFIYRGNRLGTEDFLSSWLEKHNDCMAWLQKYG